MDGTCQEPQLRPDETTADGLDATPADRGHWRVGRRGNWGRQVRCIPPARLVAHQLRSLDASMGDVRRLGRADRRRYGQTLDLALLADCCCFRDVLVGGRLRLLSHTRHRRDQERSWTYGP